MKWHIINHKDYIDGPFDTYEAALREACVLGKENRSNPRIRRRAEDFFVYLPPYDRQEHWQPCKVRLRQRANLSIALDQGVAGFLVHRLSTDEIQRRRQLKQVPSEAGVVKVDHLQVGAVDQDVFRNEVGMDETVAVGGRAKLVQVAPEHLLQAHEQGSLRA